MISPTIAEKAAILAEIDDSLLPLFPPLERAVIVALKRMKNDKDCPTAIEQHDEHVLDIEGDAHVSKI